jgi:hypothetical protein
VYCSSESPRNLEIAFDTLKDLRQKGRPTSVASLNAVLAGAAERGDIDRTMAILEDFSRNNMKPNDDSFSYALEALGKNLGRRTLTPPTVEMVDSCLAMADSLLSKMEESGISPTHHIIRDYVELLCHANEVETATSVIFEFLTHDGLVNDKSLYRVALANAELKRFDVARELAGCSREPMPFLLDAIERIESEQIA